MLWRCSWAIATAAHGKVCRFCQLWRHFPSGWLHEGARLWENLKSIGILLLKGTVPRDFRPYFVKSNSTWISHEQAKMVSRNFGGLSPTLKEQSSKKNLLGCVYWQYPIALFWKYEIWVLHTTKIVCPLSRWLSGHANFGTVLACSYRA